MSSSFHGIMPGDVHSRPGYMGPSGSPLLTGLVSWYKLDEESGPRSDTHGNNNLTDNNTVGYTAGKIGNAAVFVDASNESLTGGPLTQDSGDFTFSFWSKVSTGGREYVFEEKSSGGVVKVLFSVDSNGIASFATYDTDATKVTHNLNYGNTTNWQLVVGLYDNTARKAGLSIGGGNITWDADSHAKDLQASSGGVAHIGGDGGRADMDGLDMFGAWNRLLTQDEIALLFNLGSGLDYPF